ncbi:hypothetical protein ACJX0J_042077, partial [Zea mays]
WTNDRRRRHRTIHRRCLLLVILSQDLLLLPFLLLPRCWEETGAKDLCEGERKGRKGDRTGGGARLLTTGRRGSLSKRWIVPGWRLGWVAVCDPNRILQETKIIASITNFLNVSTDPATFVQGALPHILENTKEDFSRRIIGLLAETSEIRYREIKDIKCITCPHKPEGSMFVMVKLNLYLLEGIHDDIDFCCKLANEESVILCP